MFTVLPFRLTFSPQVFMKGMELVAAHLCISGVHVFPYLDCPFKPPVVDHVPIVFPGVFHQQTEIPSLVTA